jgi:hypothetical protein
MTGVWRKEGGRTGVGKDGKEEWTEGWNVEVCDAGRNGGVGAVGDAGRE